MGTLFSVVPAQKLQNTQKIRTFPSFGTLMYTIPAKSKFSKKWRL